MDDLLGKIVRNTVSGEIGTVRGVRALDLKGMAGVFVEVPVDGKHLPINRVWNINEIEKVEETCTK